MKKLAIAVLSFIISISGFAQINTYFTNDPLWQINITSYPTGGPDKYEDLFNYYVNGDTAISGLDYVKIFKKGTNTHYNSVGMPVSSSSYIETSPSFYLRSANRKVFIYDPPSIPDTLLYDFNLSAGDTIPETPINEGYPVITVSSTDSITTPFGFRKRLLLSNGIYLYEGCCSDGGLVETLGGYFLSGTNELLCYSINSQGFFPSASGSCDLAIGIESYQNDQSTNAFPNPFSKSTCIEFSSELKNSKLEIINSHGKLVRTISFSGRKISIDRGELKPGLYFYNVKTGDTVISGKPLLIMD